MSWKHLWTASRKGSINVKAAYLSNAFLMGMIVAIGFLLWYLTKTWVFPEFDPFSYWNRDSNFWASIVAVSVPLVLYAIFLGQLDWFNKDSDETGTIVSENIFFKGLISFFAGLFEELGHRGIFIWIGLAIIWFSNFLFMWILALILLAFAVSLASKINSIVWRLISFAFFAGIWLLVRYLVQDNPIHTINGLVFGFYQWIVADAWRIYVIYFFMMLLTLLATIELMKMGGNFRGMHPLDFLLRIVSFAVFTAYVLPKAIAVLGNLPILPPGADKWTVLLYIGAVMWSNVRFSEGHKYQGPSGVLHSSIFGFYMVYIAFTFGLLYAIVAHFLFDLFIFGSEHSVSIIKNWRKSTLG